MTQLVSRLLLAILVFPLSIALFLMVTALVTRMRGTPPAILAVAIWAVVYTFIAGYWWAIWRDLVRWTPARRQATLVAGVLALLAASVLAALIFAFAAPVPGFPALLLGGAIAPVVWVFGTVLIWRETPAERAERLRNAGGNVIACPVCGYNLTGLREARCPECGGSFKLEEILAAQRERGEIPDQ